MTYIDFNKFRKESLPTWWELWDKELSVIENLLTILMQVFVCDEKYYQAILSYLVCNSAASQILPILFVYGPKGSGKSTLGILASKLHNCHINTGADTYASIRTELDSRRNVYVDNPDKSSPQKMLKVERHVLLVWDDLDERVFSESPNLYRMLKSGYNRNSSTITIMKEGEAVKFNCFSAKLFSSIQPLHTFSKFNELERRMLIIKARAATGTDKLIQINNYDWSGFSENYLALWDNPDTAKEYFANKAIIEKTSLDMPLARKSLLLDIMATGLTLGVFECLDECLDYWNSLYNDELESNPQNSLVDLIKELLYNPSSRGYMGGITLHDIDNIPAKQIKLLAAFWYDQGWLEESPNAKSLATAMRELGFILDRGIWQKN